MDILCEDFPDPHIAHRIIIELTNQADVRLFKRILNDAHTLVRTSDKDNIIRHLLGCLGND